MRQAIVIGSTPGENPFLHDLRQSLVGCRWPVLVHPTWNFELDTIWWASKRLDEFVFLQHTMVVLDHSVFDQCFVDHVGKSVNLGSAQRLMFRMYLGKYRSTALRAVGIPMATTKNEAIQQEVAWCQRYTDYEVAHGRLVTVGAPMEHTANFEEHHGRMNMVVENEYFRKWKGTVHPDSEDPPHVREAIRSVLGT